MSEQASAPIPEISPDAKRARKTAAITVLLVIFIDLLGFGMVLPMLPYLAELCPIPDWAFSIFETLRMSEAMGGGALAVMVALMTFAFSLAQFLIAPVWGKLSDRVGRKPVLTLSLAGYIASWLLFYYAFAIAQSINMLILSRLLAGFFAANISTAQAYLADIYPPQQRSKAMGMVGAAFGLGFTLGPALGALAIITAELITGTQVEEEPLASLGAPIIGALVLTGIALFLCIFKLPESLPKELRGKRDAQRGRRLARLLEGIKKPVTGGLLLSFFTVTFGFVVLETLFSQYNNEVLELGADTNAWLFTVIGLTIAIVQGGLIGRLTKRFGSWTLLFSGLLIQGVSLICFGMTSEFWEVMVIAVLLAFGNSLTNPSILSLISQNADAREQGATMGLSQSSSAFGRLLGPIMGGAVWGWAGPTWAFACGGIMILCAIPLVARAKSRVK